MAFLNLACTKLSTTTFFFFLKKMVDKTIDKRRFFRWLKRDNPTEKTRWD